MHAHDKKSFANSCWLHRFDNLFQFLLVGGLLVAALFALHQPAAAQDSAPPNAASAQTARFVTPNDMGQGALLLQSNKPGLYIEAPLLATDVEIDVTGLIAKATVTQRFQNPSDGWVEGKYVFPLPTDAAVDGLRMQIGDRLIEGKIKEKQEAKRLYEAAKAQGIKASLVEQERPNIFTNSVANIGPGETIIVQINYQERVRFEGGAFSLRFPMVVGPRYNPSPQLHMVSFDQGQMFGTVNDPVPDRDRIEPPVQHPDLGDLNPVTLTMNLAAGFELNAIDSAHHKIKVKRNGKNGAALTLAAGEVPANKDFELVWTAAATETPTAAIFKQEIDGETYLMAMVMPPKGSATPIRRARETIFVIDNSGSMGGESIRQAKKSLLMALTTLETGDKFNIVRFDDTLETLFRQPADVSEETIARAKRFVTQLEAQGGTEMLPALQAALVDFEPQDKEHVRQVIFLTDGAIGNESQLFEEIATHLGRSRLFTVGIGSAPNTYFMSRAARLGRGTFTHIGSEAQVAERMEELFAKLENPVLTDLVAQWPAGAVAETYPDPLPDLYAGEPVVISAKVRDLEGTLDIGGNLNGQPWITQLPLKGGVDGDGVSQLWARDKIGSLEEGRFRGESYESIDKRILAVALEHHLVSRLTSLVAIDVTPSRPTEEGLTTRDVPLNLPEGWDFDKVFGEPVPTRRADMNSPMPKVQLAALNVSTAAPNAQGVNAQNGLPLPTGAENWQIFGIVSILMMIIGFAIMVFSSRRGHAA